jgi:hypothetical protein
MEDFASEYIARYISMEQPLRTIATESDAKKHRIPPGYSILNWDPTHYPIMLLGSVFDYYSIGRWIYDWAVYHKGAGMPIPEYAGKIWLILIQISTRLNYSEQCIGHIRKEKHRDILEDFIEAQERVMDKFKKLIKACEGPMIKQFKSYSREPERSAKAAGGAFVDTLFGRDGQLENTDKWMDSARLWSWRFDVNCAHLLPPVQPPRR